VQRASSAGAILDGVRGDQDEEGEMGGRREERNGFLMRGLLCTGQLKLLGREQI
jgi:hypothetical protein